MRSVKKHLIDTAEANRIITVKKLFFVITVVGLLAAFFSILLSRGNNWRFLLWNGDTIGIFPDLFESIGDGVSKNPYERNAIYPAFAYLICNLLGKCIPGFDPDSWHIMSTTKSATVVAAFFYFSCVLALMWMVEKTLERDQITYKMLSILFLCSSPFIYMLERGNMVILSLVGCMFFVCYYDSEKSFLRQLSYIMLALAAALKIYPAVFGLLIVNKKRWKDAVSLVCYGLAAFAMPFFFEGGLKNIFAMLRNAFSLSNETFVDTRGFGYGYKINIHNYFALIADYTGNNLDVIANILIVLVAVLLIISSFTCKEKWKKVACLSLLLTLIPTFSWIYNAIYMLPSFALFLRDCREDKNRKSFIYLLLFVGIYMPLPYGELFTQLDGANKITISTMVCFVSSYVLALLLIWDGSNVKPRMVHEFSGNELSEEAPSPEI